MENNTQTLDNIGQQNNNTEQSIDNESIGPVVVEKPKQRKKRETNSAAQLETLRRGREELALKRKQNLQTLKRNMKIILIN